MKAEIKAKLDLDQERAKAKLHRANFLRLHRDACLALGEYCLAMQNVQEMTTELHQPGLGGNPAAENELRKLLITENPVKALRANGLQLTTGFGWNMSCDVVPMLLQYNTEPQ